MAQTTHLASFGPVIVVGGLHAAVVLLCVMVAVVVSWLVVTGCRPWRWLLVVAAAAAVVDVECSS